MNLIDIYLTIVLAPLIGSIIAGLLGKRIGIRASPVSYTHLTLPTTPYV